MNLCNGGFMPWKQSDAMRHTKKAKTPTAKEQWSEVANAVLKKSGSEASAIRIANAAVKRRKK